jgi:Flp pilus assembly protein TadG
MYRPNSVLVRLSSEDRGAVAIIFALLSTALFGMSALAVDVARGYNARNRMASALDAAALAGAKAMDRGGSNAEIKAAATKYFAAVMAESNVGAIKSWEFDVDIKRSTATIDVSVKGSLSNIFGGLIGADTFSLNHESSVTYKTRNIELAMALDVTGSMEDDGKITDLKKAAKDVVDALFAEASDEKGVRVSLVPWSASVNAGSYTSVVTGGASSDDCVVERSGPYAATDAAPYGSDVFEPLVAAARHCPDAPLIPLSGRSKETSLKTAIENLPTTGRTAGHIGAAWGWYTVSPAWAGIWPAASQPNPYNPSDTIKGVLLMTDGLFNQTWVNAAAEGAPMVDDSYARFHAICEQMKLKKVVVYTVGFALTDARAAQALKECASGDSQHFLVTTGSELQKAFKEVATQLKGMRLTK